VNYKKKLLVTGISGGIGSAIATLFRENNWYVIGIDMRKPDSDEYFDEFYNVDLSKEAGIREFCDLLSKKHEVLDAIINNAATQISKSIVDLSVEDWDKTFDVNVKAPFLLVKLLFPLLRKSGLSSIVNVSSVHSIATSENISAYAASKGALTVLTRAMALEFAKCGIRVNAVLPGAVDTQMLREGLSRGHLKNDNIEEKMKELSARHPLLRVGDPKDVAKMVLFLADHSCSSFVTGQTFVVDGGATARLSTE